VRVDSSRNVFRGSVEDVARQMEFTPRFLFSPRERANLVVRVRVAIDDPREELHAGIPAFATIERSAAAPEALR
jgi:HlyD family secretion protein